MNQIFDFFFQRDILLIYHYLGIKVQNPQEILGFVRSLYDDKTGFYSRRLGESGSLEATYAAFQVFTLLGTLKSPFVTNNIPKLQTILSQALIVQDQEAFFSFSSEKGLSAVIFFFPLITNILMLSIFYIDFCQRLCSLFERSH